jgi:tyrosinase
VQFKGKEISVREHAGRRELYVEGVHIPTDYGATSKQYVAHHHIPNWAFDSLEELAVTLIDNRVKLRLDHHHHHHHEEEHPDRGTAPDRGLRRGAGAEGPLRSHGPALATVAASRRVRRNQLSLSDEERARFVAAVKKMKEPRPPDDSVYDKYVKWHLESMPEGTISPAHGGPAFLPWHRQFILFFENDLRAADKALGNDGSITLPYWDWTDPVSRGAAPLLAARIWKEDFMGGDGDPADFHRVTTGPFATDWPLPYNAGDLPFLTRRFGLDGFSLLSAYEDWTEAKKAARYDAPSWDWQAKGKDSFRNSLEGFQPKRQLHNLVHRWVGGSMAPTTSPNDPIFFLHHCNVDRLWALWQIRRGPKKPAYLPDPLQTGPDRGPAPQGHNLDDPMPPWVPPETTPAKKPRDMLNHRALGYSYDTDPPNIGLAGP